MCRERRLRGPAVHRQWQRRVARVGSAGVSHPGRFGHTWARCVYEQGDAHAPVHFPVARHMNVPRRRVRVSRSASRKPALQLGQRRAAAIHALVHRVKAFVAAGHRRGRGLGLVCGARLVVAVALGFVEERADRRLLHVERPRRTSRARGRLLVRIPEIHRFGGHCRNGRAGRRARRVLSARGLFLRRPGGPGRRRARDRSI